MIWDLHTLLMVDPNLIDQQDNLSLVREEAYKHDANPLCGMKDAGLSQGGKATDLQMRLICKQDGVYRLWYAMWGLASAGEKFAGANKYGMYGYAESTDGVRFKPVRVNQVKYNGSKRNNLIDFSVPGEPSASASHMLYDPLDSEFPFKCIYYRQATAAQLEPGILARMQYKPEMSYKFVWGIGKSRDGLHWQPPEHDHNLVNANPETARLHRAIDGAYVISDQMVSSVVEGSGRNVKGWLSYDGVTSHRIPGWVFDLPEHMVRLYPEFSGVACKMQFNNAKWVQPHIGLVCARKGPTIVGLNGYLYYPPHVETFAQKADVGLVVSHSGYSFREVLPFRPFIPRGPRGTWDAGLVCQGNILDDGDQTRFYYTGNDVGNLGGSYRIGMAYIPRDQYGYLLIRGHRDIAARPRQATATLKPVALPENAQLAINATHLSKGGSIRLQLMDEQDKPLRGFAFKDCTPVTRDGLRKKISWKNDKQAASLAGRRVKIGVQINHPNCGFVCHDSPRLYAIYLK